MLSRRLPSCLSLLSLLMSTMAPAQAAPAKPVEIELTHQLGADKGEQLQKLVERFNAQSKAGQIVLREGGWEINRQAALAVLRDSDAQTLQAAKRIKPLWQVMREAGANLATLPVPPMMVPSGTDSANRLVALPVGLSSPVVFHNRELLAQAGVDVEALPRDWRGWQEVLGRLYQSGEACPMTVSEPVSTLIENAGAWNNQAFVKTAKGGKGEQIAVNGLIQVKHLALLTTWRKANYLHYFGRSSEGEETFANGECAVLAAPSSAYPSLRRQAKFTVGVSGYPYHDDAYGAPQNTWADGPALWVAAGRSAAEYKLVASFIRFWLAPESQLEWQVNAGYLPLNPSGLLVAQTSQLLADDLAAQRLAIAQLTHKPVTAASKATAFGHRPGVREVIAEEIESVFADRKPAKQGLDDAVQRIERLR
ncbi:MAG: glycerol-3-phosphate ABC transporter substrate-binding protein [Candidatus Dactylopiibacterium carminicum]|nr:MAG: glycerol-3-phosphate ABC transporter substrate-binding protein [Candidatus Dactylopiibacterium carminicum]